MQANFLSLADLSSDELTHLLDLAAELKAEQKSGHVTKRLQDKSLAMVFQKPSLRTRVSFEMAMEHQGGHAVYLSPNEIQLGKRESIPDAARVLSRYVDGIMARVFAHNDVVTMAEWAGVPVINGLSDFNHPCQGLTDLLTIREKLGQLQGATLVYVGDGNNVTHSLLYGGALSGMHIRVASPEGYDPLPEVVAQARQMCEVTDGSVTLYRDPAEAVRDVNVIYTDTWVSMGQEAETAKRAEVFPPYQVNAALVAQAPADAGVMHDLPAYRGKEITDEVADGAQSWLFDQAENRLHAQKAVLVELLG